MRIGVLLPQVKGPEHAGEWLGQAGSPRAGGSAALLASGAARRTRGVSGGHSQGGHGCVPGDQAPRPPSGALRPSSPGGHVPRIPNLWAPSWTREPRGAPRGRRLRLVWPSGRRAGSEGTAEADGGRAAAWPPGLPSSTVARTLPRWPHPRAHLRRARLPFVWPCPPGGRRGPIRQGPGCEMHPASAAGSAGSLASPTVAKAVSPRGRRASISHAAPRGQRQVSSAVWPGHREPPRPVGAAGCRPSSEMERGIPLPGHGLDGRVQQRGRGHGGLVTRHGCTCPPELGTMTRGPRARLSRSARWPGPFVIRTLARAMAAWPSHPTRRPCALP